MRKPFQFSLRRILCAVALLALAARFAILFIADRLDPQIKYPKMRC